MTEVSNLRKTLCENKDVTYARKVTYVIALIDRQQSRQHYRLPRRQAEDQRQLKLAVQHVYWND